MRITVWNCSNTVSQPVTDLEVLLEPAHVGFRQRAVEVRGDELDELVARKVVDRAGS